MLVFVIACVYDVMMMVGVSESAHDHQGPHDHCCSYGDDCDCHVLVKWNVVVVVDVCLDGDVDVGCVARRWIEC